MKRKKSKAKTRKGAARGLGVLRSYLGGRLDDVRTLSDAAFAIGERAVNSDDYKAGDFVADVVKLSGLSFSTWLNGFKVPPVSLVVEPTHHGDEGD